jgi:general secretion pathway protein K
MISDIKNTTNTNREKGAVLLTTLLVASLMASLAISMLDVTRLSIKRTQNLQDVSQLEWQIKGAEDFVMVYLNDLLATVSPSELGEKLRDGETVVLPTEQGAISCFSLGTLKTATGHSQFRRLLENLNWDSGPAQAFAALAADWSDSDTQISSLGGEDFTYLSGKPAHRTANTDFSSPMELRSLSGLTEDAYQTLRPFICARSSQENSVINVNTIDVWQAPLLASVLGSADAMDRSVQLIENRPAGGYSSSEDFLAADALQGANLDEFDVAAISFEPKYIWIEANVNYQSLNRALVLDISIKDGLVRKVSGRRSPEYIRPMLKPESEEQ